MSAILNPLFLCLQEQNILVKYANLNNKTCRSRPPFVGGGGESHVVHFFLKQNKIVLSEEKHGKNIDDDSPFSVGIRI